MRNQIIATWLLLAITLSAAQTQQQNMKLMTVLNMITTKANDCFLNKKTPMADIITAIIQVSGNNMNATKLRCFPTCVLEKLGIMTVANHTFSADAMKSNAETIPHQKMKELLVEQMPVCFANATSEDSCEKGLQLVDCYNRAGLLHLVETSVGSNLASPKILHPKLLPSPQNVFRPPLSPRSNSLPPPERAEKSRSRRQTPAEQKKILKRRQNSRSMVLNAEVETFNVTLDPLPTLKELPEPQADASVEVLVTSTTVAQSDATSRVRKLPVEDFSIPLNVSSARQLPDIQYHTDTLHIPGAQPVNNMSSFLPQPLTNLSLFLPSIHNLNKRPRVQSILTKSSLPKKPKAKVTSGAQATLTAV